MEVLDCDSHVQEGERTFADPYWDPRYLGRRPMVVESDVQHNLSFVIDSLTHQRLTGPSITMSGSPMSKNGVPSPLFSKQMEAAAGKGHIDTLESAELHTAQARLEQMDRESLAMQVNFPSMLLTWPIAHDPKIANAIARSYNSWIADVSSQAPDRLKWVTVINPGDVEESVREIRRTKELGSVGLMILGSVGNKHWDHPSLEPIWATVAELDMPVAVHPGFCNPGLDEQYSNGIDAVTMAFVFSLLVGYQAILRSGLLDRYPNLRVAFMENGARWVDFMTMRIAEFSGKILERTTTRARPKTIDEADIGGSSLFRPSTYLSELIAEEYIKRGQIYVNCEVDEDQLPFIVERYGDDFLTFAGDIPHPHRISHSVDKFLARQDLREETKRKIMIDNTARFYGLPVPAREPEPVPSAGD